MNRTDTTTPAWRIFFLVAGVYDLLLGLAFMLAGETILEAIERENPDTIADLRIPRRGASNRSA